MALGLTSDHLQRPLAAALYWSYLTAASMAVGVYWWRRRPASRFGPLLVVYPETVWYAGVRPEDVEEIVREHLVGGRPVERLRYRNRPGKNKLPRDAQNRPIGRPARHE